MTYPPRPAGDVFAIPIHLDPEVPAGTAVLDLDPELPRHITRIRAAGRDFILTADQQDQVRDHYRAMDERAGELLAWWDRVQLAEVIEPADPPVIRRLPVRGPELAGLDCTDPDSSIRITGT